LRTRPLYAWALAPAVDKVALAMLTFVFVFNHRLDVTALAEEETIAAVKSSATALLMMIAFQIFTPENERAIQVRASSVPASCCIAAVHICDAF